MAVINPPERKMAKRTSVQCPVGKLFESSYNKIPEKKNTGNIWSKIVI